MRQSLCVLSVAVLISGCATTDVQGSDLAPCELFDRISAVPNTEWHQFCDIKLDSFDTCRSALYPAGMTCTIEYDSGYYSERYYAFNKEEPEPLRPSEIFMSCQSRQIASDEDAEKLLVDFARQMGRCKAVLLLEKDGDEAFDFKLGNSLEGELELKWDRGSTRTSSDDAYRVQIEVEHPG